MTDKIWTKSQELSSPDLGDYFELLKPKVMRLVVFTAFVGMMIAPVSVNPILGFIALLAIALGAGASGALNMYIDSDIDAVMSRTIGRPIPSGRVAREHALTLGIGVSIFSVAMLGVFANWASAAFLAFTIFFYVVIYSLGLKRRTPQNIVIGGAAGAFPPMIGWMVATGGISIESIMMFMVIFLWTPPHFWALALFRTDDYSRANVPMLPVVKGERATRIQIFVYSILLFISTMITSFLSIGGPIVFAVSLALGGLFIIGGWKILNRKDGEADKFKVEKRYFGLSIVFLFVFFLALLAESLMGQFWAISAFWPRIGA